MYKSYKIRLKPTKEQEIMLRKHLGNFRYAYNFGLSKVKENYENGIKYNFSEIRKSFTQHKKEAVWLNETSATSALEAFRNLDNGMKRFFKNNNGFPQFKSKKNSRESFYVRPSILKFKNNRACFEKIGWIIFKSDRKIPKTTKYSNPYCHFDGKYWILSFAIESSENQVDLNKELKIGVDVGIKNLAICSNGMIFKNINKSKEVKRLNKKLKRNQRKAFKKYTLNKKGNKFVKTNNILKLERKIKLIYRKLTNIRNNNIHQMTSSIVKLNPFRVVIEDLNIMGMMRNKRFSKHVAECKFYEIRRQLEYKCENNGIELILADRWFPSSKTCSSCGIIKKDLKLKDRVFKCQCGFTVDRDYNASLNLMNYN